MNSQLDAHLGPCIQQQFDALGLSPEAGLVQGGDGVVGDGVDAGAALDQLLQLQDLPSPGSLVHRGPVSPETWEKRGEISGGAVEIGNWGWGVLGDVPGEGWSEVG